MEIARLRKRFSPAFLGGGIACVFLLGLSCVYLSRSFQIKAAYSRHYRRLELMAPRKAAKSEDEISYYADSLLRPAAKILVKNKSAYVDTPRELNAECITVALRLQWKKAQRRASRWSEYAFLPTHTSETCVCGAGPLDSPLVKKMLNSLENVYLNMQDLKLYLYLFGSCEDIEAANVHAAMFNAGIAAFWVLFMFIRKHRMQRRSSHRWRSDKRSHTTMFGHKDSSKIKHFPPANQQYYVI